MHAVFVPTLIAYLQPTVVKQINIFVLQIIVLFLVNINSNNNQVKRKRGQYNSGRGDMFFSI